MPQTTSPSIVRACVMCVVSRATHRQRFQRAMPLDARSIYIDIARFITYHIYHYPKTVAFFVHSSEAVCLKTSATIEVSSLSTSARPGGATSWPVLRPTSTSHHRALLALLLRPGRNYRWQAASTSLIRTDTRSYSGHFPVIFWSYSSMFQHHPSLGYGR